MWFLKKIIIHNTFWQVSWVSLATSCGVAEVSLSTSCGVSGVSLSTSCGVSGVSLSTSCEVSGVSLGTSYGMTLSLRSVLKYFLWSVFKCRWQHVLDLPDTNTLVFLVYMIKLFISVSRKDSIQCQTLNLQPLFYLKHFCQNSNHTIISCNDHGPVSIPHVTFLIILDWPYPPSWLVLSLVLNAWSFPLGAGCRGQVGSYHPDKYLSSVPTPVNRIIHTCENLLTRCSNNNLWQSCTSETFNTMMVDNEKILLDPYVVYPRNRLLPSELRGSIWGVSFRRDILQYSRSQMTGVATGMQTSNRYHTVSHVMHDTGQNPAYHAYWLFLGRRFCGYTT